MIHLPSASGLALTSTLVLAAAVPMLLPAAELLNENFADGLPPWVFVDNAGSNSGKWGLEAGHDGSGESTGSALHIGNFVDNAPNASPGAWVQPLDLLVAPTEDWSLTFDLMIPGEAFNNDDAGIMFGDLDGRNFYHLLFNENPEHSDLYHVADNARVQDGSPAVNAFSNDWLFDSTWYRGTLTWTASSNTLDLALVHAASGIDAGSFSVVLDGSIEAGNGSVINPAPASFAPDGLQFGFGTFNDRGRFDNLMIDGTDPTIVTAADDQIEVGVGGAIRFDPLGNDQGALFADSVQILSGPAAGAASVDPGTGEIIYKHGGGPAGTDMLRYRVESVSGVSSGEANVAITVSDEIRLAGTPPAVPLDPPTTAPGTLVIEDALGTTFPGAVAMTTVPGTPEALFVASIDGSIWYVPDTTAANPTKHKVLDISSLSNFTRGRSIYSMTCYPDFAATGHVIVNYQGDMSRLPLPGAGQTVRDVMVNLDKNGSPNSTIECDLRVSRFTLSSSHLADVIADGLSDVENAQALDTEFPFINLAEQHLFHSINDAKFGPDGYLYLTFGDEGDQGDPYWNGQRLTKDIFSSMIRIDVDPNSTNPKPNPHYMVAVGPLVNGKHGFFSDPATQEPNFRVPEDNPFIHTSEGGDWDGMFNGMDLSGDLAQVRTEIWALGLRNPFKFHLDVEDGTGEVEAWIGDVGKDHREEFTILKKGENGGWSYYEGDIETPGVSHPDMPSGSTPHKEPLFSYERGLGNSATGGIFYRDGVLPGLTDTYVCGDYGSGRIWSVTRDGQVAELTNLRLGGNQMVDFEIDEVTKDIFVLEHGTGRVRRITVQGAGVPENFPVTLSETGIFADLADLSTNPGVVPYEPNLTFWSDGADKKRWFVLPNESDTIGYSRDGKWSFPEGMVWVKHFDFDMDRQNPGTNVKRLETRLLVRNAGGAYGVSYRWNGAGTEAVLVDTEGDDFDLNYADEVGADRTLAWRIPSRSECLTCHTPSGGHALSTNTRQFNTMASIHGNSGNLLQLLADGGYLSGFSDDPATLGKHAKPSDTSVNLEDRVRAYLDVNCSYCHQPGSSISANWDGRAHVPLDEAAILYGGAVSESTPDHTDHIIRPGDLEDSAIWNKINARTAINGTFNGYGQMPPLASNAFDEEGIELLREWILNYANVPPAPAPGSLGSANVSENAPVGVSPGRADSVDPDQRVAGDDQDNLSYTIISGNERRLFTLDPATGEVGLNGFLDYEDRTEHVLTIEVSDNFAPNPKTELKTVIVNVIDETTGDLTEDSDGNGIFDAWEMAHVIGDPDPSLDSDRDGLNNFFEFLSGGDPQAGESPSALGLQFSLERDPEEQHLSWRVRNGFVLGGHYGVQSSAELDGWSILEPADYEVVSVEPDGPGVSRVTIKIHGASGAGFHRMTRLPVVPAE